MCFYKMYALYFPCKSENGTKLFEFDKESVEHSSEFQLRFTFPIHKKIKKFQMKKFYCVEHLAEYTSSYQKIDYVKSPDISTYINSFLNIKKESITKDEMFGYSKDRLIEKYKMSLINQKEVRPIDNLIHWAIVMPPADDTY